MATAAPETLFAGASVLHPDVLVEAVMARNPNLEAAREGWRAALAQYRQATALEDPRLSYSLAPRSIGSSVPFGQEIELRQMFPFPGKLGLSGAVAMAEAEVARADYEVVRLELASMAALLAYEAYWIERALEINEDHIRFLEEVRAIASARYESGTVTQEEPLEAEVESSHLAHRRIELESARTVVQAELNALLHRAPDAAIPPPLPALDPPEMGSIDQSTLMSMALDGRPELRAANAEIRGLEASTRLASLESLPDFGLMVSYNNMWLDPEHQWMVGVELNLPVQLGPRTSLREGSRSRLDRARSRQSAKEDAVRLEIVRAATRLTEMAHTVDLYRSRILPASRDRISAARAAFESGRVPALTLIDAERNLRDSELGYEEALTSYNRSRVELFRALGRIPSHEGDLP
jgi:outer membrane protein TolC